MVVSGKFHAPVASLGVNIQVPFEKEAGCVPEQAWTSLCVRRSLLYLTKFEPRTVQPVTSRCTDLVTTVCPSLDVVHPETLTDLHTVCKQYRHSTNNLNIEERPCKPFLPYKSNTNYILSVCL
jgi:hypothetical protein